MPPARSAYVDGVHATPHGPIDVSRLGADFYATSSYKWAGPHIGAVVGRPEVLARRCGPTSWYRRATTCRIASSGARAPLPTSPESLRLSTIWHPSIPTPADRGESGCSSSMAASERHERALFASLLDGLGKTKGVITYGAAGDRTSTAYFNLAGFTPRAVAEHLAARQVNVWDGDNYAYELTVALGIADSGAAVRAGLVHYNDQSDVDRLLAGLAELAER